MAFGGMDASENDNAIRCLLCVHVNETPSAVNHFN